jgi:sugar/nucleoside kinase (ribokinase family)
VGREVYADGFSVTAGAHFNTAAALARLNVRVGLVAAVGADELGSIVLRAVREEGLPEEFIHVLPSVPTAVSVALNLGSDRGFVTYSPDYDRVEAHVVAAMRALLEDGAASHVHGDLSNATPELLALARSAGMSYSVDAHDAGPSLASPEVRGLVASVDLLFANEREALAMTETDDWRTALFELARDTPHVVLKRGELGSASAVGGELHEAPAEPVPVLDATGAGDCFAAGYLWAYRRGRSPAACLAAGNVCGAAAVGSIGGYRGALREADVVVATA